MNRSAKSHYAILGMLSIEPMSGYDIKKNLHDSTNFFWQESDGQIYPTLAKLLKTKSISLVPLKTKKLRERIVYKITAKGMQELEEWLEKEPIKSTPRNELLLKLYFGLNTSQDINIKHIEEHQRKLTKSLSAYNHIEKEIAGYESPHVPYWLLTLSFGQVITKAQLEWCKSALTLLKKSK